MTAVVEITALRDLKELTGNGHKVFPKLNTSLQPLNIHSAGYTAHNGHSEIHSTADILAVLLVLL
jgi:hypothetical protein